MAKRNETTVWLQRPELRLRFLKGDMWVLSTEHHHLLPTFVAILGVDRQVEYLST